jgi:anti-sigma factor RsiW
MCRAAEEWGEQMICSRELIEGYLDEELGSDLRAEVQDHIAHCHTCSETYTRIQQQKVDIRAMAPSYTAPESLQHSVRNAVRLDAEREVATHNRHVNWRWLAIAASVLLLVSMAWNVTRLLRGPAGNDLLAQNIMSSHVRSLIGTHLLDVPSSDQHTVKPWFNGKLDFSPQVKDLVSQGFPLIGGRIEYLSDRAVAALVYRRRQHVINLFTWPAASSAGNMSEWSRNGYNLVHWTDSGMTYWAVSDIPAVELQQFKSLYLR